MIEWLKAFHIIAIIAWMAGLLYLPRLFIYHSNAPKGSLLDKTLKIMERRLLKAIMTPAMIASWVFGFWLAVEIDIWIETWFHIKIFFVLGLSFCHWIMVLHQRKFSENLNIKSDRYFRILNEIPTLFMIIIIIMVIVKPI